MRISDWSSDVCSSDLRDSPACDLRADQCVHRRRQVGRDGEDGEDEGHCHRDRGHRHWATSPPADCSAVSKAASSMSRSRLTIVVRASPHSWSTNREERRARRSEENTSDLQSLMSITYADYSLKKQKIIQMTKT